MPGEFRDNEGPADAVDYQHLGTEELGSIYESLLELVPRRTGEPSFSCCGTPR